MDATTEAENQAQFRYYKSRKRTRLDFSPVRARPDDTYLVGTSDEDSEDTRARKKQRRESFAQEYLKYGRLPICTASLRGPFEDKFKHPWAKTRNSKMVETIDLTGDSNDEIPADQEPSQQPAQAAQQSHASKVAHPLQAMHATQDSHTSAGPEGIGQSQRTNIQASAFNATSQDIPTGPKNPDNSEKLRMTSRNYLWKFLPDERAARRRSAVASQPKRRHFHNSQAQSQTLLSMIPGLGLDIEQTMKMGLNKQAEWIESRLKELQIAMAQVNVTHDVDAASISKEMNELFAMRDKIHGILEKAEPLRTSLVPDPCAIATGPKNMYQIPEDRRNADSSELGVLVPPARGSPSESQLRKIKQGAWNQIRKGKQDRKVLGRRGPIASSDDMAFKRSGKGSITLEEHRRRQKGKPSNIARASKLMPPPKKARPSGDKDSQTVDQSKKRPLAGDTNEQRKRQKPSHPINPVASESARTHTEARMPRKTVVPTSTSTPNSQQSMPSCQMSQRSSAPVPQQELSQLSTSGENGASNPPPFEYRRTKSKTKYPHLLSDSQKSRTPASNQASVGKGQSTDYPIGTGTVEKHSSQLSHKSSKSSSSGLSKQLSQAATGDPNSDPELRDLIMSVVKEYGLPPPSSNKTKGTSVGTSVQEGQKHRYDDVDSGVVGNAVEEAGSFLNTWDMERDSVKMESL